MLQVGRNFIKLGLIAKFLDLLELAGKTATATKLKFVKNAAIQLVETDLSASKISAIHHICIDVRRYFRYSILLEFRLGFGKISAFIQLNKIHLFIQINSAPSSELFTTFALKNAALRYSYYKFRLHSKTFLWKGLKNNVSDFSRKALKSMRA